MDILSTNKGYKNIKIISQNTEDVRRGKNKSISIIISFTINKFSSHNTHTEYNNNQTIFWSLFLTWIRYLFFRTHIYWKEHRLNKDIGSYNNWSTKLRIYFLNSTNKKEHVSVENKINLYKIFQLNHFFLFVQISTNAKVREHFFLHKILFKRIEFLPTSLKKTKKFKHVFLCYIRFMSCERCNIKVIWIVVLSSSWWGIVKVKVNLHREKNKKNVTTFFLSLSSYLWPLRKKNLKILEC